MFSVVWQIPYSGLHNRLFKETHTLRLHMYDESMLHIFSLNKYLKDTRK